MSACLQSGLCSSRTIGKCLVDDTSSSIQTMEATKIGIRTGSPVRLILREPIRPPLDLLRRMVLPLGGSSASIEYTISALH